MNTKLKNIKQHHNNGDHVHLYGDAVATIAHEIFGSDEDHLDVMPNNTTIAEDHLILDSNKGQIEIYEDDILAVHVPDQP